MKDLLTTAASIIVILFCISLLFLSEGEESYSEESAPTTNQNAVVQSGFAPAAQTTLFTRVQSVKVRHGVLMFAAIEEGNVKEYYFLLRDKNVILIKESNSEMPVNSILFKKEEDGTMRVIIPDTLDIDLMQELAGN